MPSRHHEWPPQRRFPSTDIINGVEVVVNELKAQLARHFLQSIYFPAALKSRLVGAIMPTRRRLGTSSLKSPMRFCVIASTATDCVLHVSGERPARVRIAFDYACLDKVGSLGGKNDRHVRKGSIKPVYSVERASDDDDTCIELTQFDSMLRIPTEIPFGGPDGKGIVHPIDEALILQSLPERCNSLVNRRHIRFLHHRKPDQRHVRLCLGIPRSRSTQRGRADHPDEITPLHAPPSRITARQFNRPTSTLGRGAGAGRRNYCSGHDEAGRLRWVRSGRESRQSIRNERAGKTGRSVTGCMRNWGGITNRPANGYFQGMARGEPTKTIAHARRVARQR